MPILTIQEPSNSDVQENQEQEIAIGIDLGTTNSLVAIAINQKPEVLLDEKGDFMQPSIASFVDGEFLIGKAAQNFSGEKIYSIKRLMGKGFDEIDADNNLLFNTKKNGDQLQVAMANQHFSPVEISAQILKHLKKIAENNLQKTISKAVITVPAYFDEAARNATKQAANLAGLEVLRLISEPTAAAVAYGLDKKIEGVYLVFDLGGGTFDVSILQLSSGVFKVIGVGGDAALGGDDFDNLIGQKIIQENNLKNPSIATLQNIKLIGKEIKEKLTHTDFAEINFDLENQKLNFKLSKKEFENLSQNLLEKTIKITKNLLTELDLENDQITAVILVGGSTRMNIVQEKLSDLFGQTKILSDIDPDKIVALGAAIQAEALTSRNSDNLLLDVIPLSLGIEMMGGLVEKIIERNSTIPASAAKEFTTYIDGQNAMKLHIVQGERELAKDCRSLAHFEIKNIPNLKAGVARVRVVFKIDADGLLTVSATEQITGESQTIEVKPSFGLNESQVKNMLLESLKNSKQDILERVLIEAKVEAKRNILALQSELVDDADLIDDEFLQATKAQIANLEIAIQADNHKQINIEAENLERFAEQLSEKKMNKVIGESLIGKKIDEI